MSGSHPGQDLWLVPAAEAPGNKLYKNGLPSFKQKRGAGLFVPQEVSMVLILPKDSPAEKENAFGAFLFQLVD
jgi:hypothetical protein